MENPSESGGSFDASGAFHGGPVCSDEEEVSTVNFIDLSVFVDEIVRYVHVLRFMQTFQENNYFG